MKQGRYQADNKRRWKINMHNLISWSKTFSVKQKRIFKKPRMKGAMSFLHH
ncbi:Uncharacterised protein [Burkholderia pseudomallei]|nr:Uncharacterised protein [Burkholderia pseudomallei]